MNTQLKYVVARTRGNCKIGKVKMPILEAPNERLIAFNEPFIIQLGSDQSLSRIPLVKLFGPGYYWKVCGEPGDPAIVGEGENGWELTKGRGKHRQSDVFHMRRSGRIYGRWYSKFSPIGEWGDYLFDEVQNISYVEYQGHLSDFRSQHARMDW